MKLALVVILAAVAILAAACEPQQPANQSRNNTPPAASAAECITNSDCATAGCSGQLCVQAGKAADIITTCEYKAEYDCLKMTSCGCNEGRCAWAATEEYESCLNDIKK